jgi:hypothetical protein
LASNVTNLQRPLDALRVVTVDAGGCLGVKTGQLGVHDRPTFASCSLIDLAPHLRGSLRERGEAVQQCTQIEHCSTYEQWGFAACVNLLDGS